MSAIVRRGLGTIGLLLLSATVVGAQSPASSPQAPAAQKPPSGSQSGPPDARELANQVNNPAAPVTLLQFRNLLFPSVEGTDGATNALEIQPVLPIGPFASFRYLQLIKITLPFPSLPSPVNAAGVGDLQVFDVFVFKASWGQWGLGPALVFPTASDDALGDGKWQAGPAMALMYTRIKNLMAGAVVQNPMSFAGNSDRPGVNALIITPTLTYNLEDGWFVGLSDYDWEFDWKHGGDATFVLGPQFGRVFHIGHHAFSASIEVGGALAKPSTAPSPGWIFGFEFSPIFKGHIK